jgi:L-2-hydroxyglutarate oxidase
MSPSPPTACDTVIVGAGIVGLATAREALLRRPGSQVVVLERGPGIAGGQTGSNSGVIHAGVYYAPGSRKARLCVDGARRLYALCDELGVPAERCGKLIVARSASELPRLAELERRAAANGVTVRRLDGAGIADVEPHARGVAALHVPDTGIVDFARVADALLRDVLARGGLLVTGCPVAAVTGGVVRHARGSTRAATVIACAGMDADRLARRSGGPADPRIVPFRGSYLRLRRPELVRALIYPVPDPALPFLGVHLTRRLQGDVVAGPTALPALTGLRDTLTWPGTWRMAWRWRRHAVRELGYAMSRAAYAREVRTLVPEVTDEDLVPAFAGVRAQAVGRDGALLDDFVLEGSGGALHVRNAPSPAATAALAIAGELADRAGLRSTAGA